MIDREQWLKERRKSIGGSDVAAILGLSKWRTALEVYLEKRGELPAQELTSDRIDAGNKLQRPIIDTYCERENVELVAYEPSIIRHPDFPFLAANLDAIVKNEFGDEWNVDSKNIHWRVAEEWGSEGSDSMPDDAFYQGHQYNFITRRQKTDFAVLVGGEWPPRVYSVPRDDEFFEMLLGDLEKFWWHVEHGEQPPPDFAHETTAALMKRLYPDVDVNKNITLPADYFEKVVRYRALGKIATLAEKKRELLKAELLFAVGDAAKARIEGSDVELKRIPVTGGKVVNYVTKPYVRLDSRFPKNYEAPAIEATAVALIEGETNG